MMRNISLRVLDYNTDDETDELLQRQYSRIESATLAEESTLARRSLEVSPNKVGVSRNC